mmetsp:Transcript_24041/g.38544  ORF Transcript_24041/g.38544 Transcript_24041/m.38544 type:complete len:257 (-) Transcript_24041:743-1513(-)
MACLVKGNKVNNIDLDHSLNKCVNLLSAVSCISSLVKVKKLLLVSTKWSRKLHWPQKVRCCFEVRSALENFVNKIFYTDNVVLSKSLLNYAVVSNWDTLLVDLSESSLVDQLLNSLEVRFTVYNVWLNKTKHVDGSLVKTNEYCVVDLAKTQKLQDLANLRSVTKNTTDTNNNSYLWLWVNKDVARCLCSTAHTDELILVSLVLLNVLLSTLKCLLAASAALLSSSSCCLLAASFHLLGGCSSLKNGFWNTTNQTS